MLQPTQKDTTKYKVDGQLTERTLLESLRLKHPKAREPSTKTLERYANAPPKVKITIIEDMVGATSGKLSGGAGLGGPYATALQQLLSARGSASTHLRYEVAHFVEWIVNFNVPWAAICGFMNNRLIALDKMPGIRPIGIGKIWRRLSYKVLLMATMAEATEACGVDNLHGGLETGIEGDIYAAKEMWQEMDKEAEVGFTLVDARNAFNEINRIVMLWTVRRIWPSESTFIFNCYKHHNTLTIRGDNRFTCYLHSQEGVTQGCLLAMVLYALGLIPLIKILKHQIQQLQNTWFADDGAAGGKWEDIKCWYDLLLELGPPVTTSRSQRNLR